MDLIPLVSIIIVNYNGKKYLEKCLGSLAGCNYKKTEIILVDNGSTDDSMNYVNRYYPGVGVINLDKNYGYAEANNIGAKKAQGEYLLFLNNDTIVTSDFVTELITVATRDENIAICQSLLLKPDGQVDSSGDFVDTLGRAYSSKNKPADIRNILSARGASMIIQKNVFWELGGFDKNYFVSFEDVDLGWRAWIKGYKVVLVPKSVVYHMAGQTVQKLDSLIHFHGVKNTLLLRLVNFELFYAAKSIVLLFFVSLARKFFGISLIKDPEVGPPLPSFKTIFQGVIWILGNLKYILAKRKEVNSKRVCSTKDLIRMGVITKISR